MSKLILTVGLVSSTLTPNEIKKDGTLVHISEAIINIQNMTTLYYKLNTISNG